MSEIIFEITEDETDGGFTASALGHAIVTEADTRELLRLTCAKRSFATSTKV